MLYYIILYYILYIYIYSLCLHFCRFITGPDETDTPGTAFCHPSGEKPASRCPWEKEEIHHWNTSGFKGYHINHIIIELDDGKIYRKTLVSCRFSLKSIQ